MADDKVIEYYKDIYARGTWELDFFEYMIANRLRQEIGLPLEAWQPARQPQASTESQTPCHA